MYRCESWTIKKAEELMLSNCGAESPLDSKEIKLVNPKGSQLWTFIGRTNVETEALIPDIGKDWRQKEKRVTEDKMIGLHHRVDGHELGQSTRDGEGQGGLACCSPWDRRFRHDWATEQQEASLCAHVQLVSHVWLFGTPWTVAHQAPLSLGFPK